MKKIFFRADGNAEIGLGHLMRSIALGCMLKDFFDLTFVCKEIPDKFRHQIKKYGFSYFKIDNEDEFIKNISAEIIIVLDGYHFDIDYQRKIKAIGCKLVCIDDLHDQEFAADLIINHAPDVKSSEYRAQVYTQYALGLKYTLVRPIFLTAAKKKREIIKFETLFICFGGSDALNLTYRVVLGAMYLENIKKINIVIGGSYGDKEIFALKETASVEINIYRDIDELELAEVMANSHFGVTSASTVSYEVCCVKMPLLCGYYVENQKIIYAGLLRHNVVLGGGDFSNYTVEDFKNRLEQLLDENKSSAYVENQSKLFDSKIRNRIIRLFSNIESKNIGCRQAKEKDIHLLYDWTNDELVRQQSYSAEKISFETHTKWFKEKINDVNALIYILEVEGIPAGVVKFDLKNENAVIGISIDKSFRQRGLASEFLKKAAKEYFQKNELPILAYIKKDNIASVKSFEKSGFIFLKEVGVEGIQSVLYQLTKIRTNE